VSEETPSLQTGARQQRDLILRGLLILVLVFLAYYPALQGGYVWDDDHYVTANPMLTAPDGLRQIWFSKHNQSQYFPLAFTTLRFEYSIWGLEPMGYHLVNILFHGANALLLWTVLRRLAVPGAWFAAAIFAVHPVQVESVAWISELKNVQSTCFYLVALLAWLKFADPRTARAWRFYGLALLCHGLALTSKTTACTLPAAMLLALWLRREPIGRRRLVQLVPFVALALGMGAISILWERHLGNYDNFEQGLSLNFSAPERLLIATRALWFYASKLVWPVHLTFSYPRWDIHPASLPQYLWLAGCLAVALLLWLFRRALGRGPATAVLFFFATLTPMLGIISCYTFRYSFVADHYQYLAGAGLMVLFAAAASAWMTSMRQNIGVQRTLASARVLVLGALTWRQAGIYKDKGTLWSDTVAENPGSWMAHDNLGAWLVSQQRFDDGIAEFRKAIQVKPRDVYALYNLGWELMRKGEFAEAIGPLTAAVETMPGIALAQYHLGVALDRVGRIEEAVDHYRVALQPRLMVPLGQSDSVMARYFLATALLELARTRDAVAEYRQVLSLNPQLPPAQNNLAWILATDSDPAVRNGAEAVQLTEQLCQETDYRTPAFLSTLAAAYAEAARFPEAVVTAEKARALALEAGDTALAAKNADRLELYRAGRPCRESVSPRKQ
jgi:Tfp pilus assembly protein PilF